VKFLGYFYEQACCKNDCASIYFLNLNPAGITGITP